MVTYLDGPSLEILHENLLQLENQPAELPISTCLSRIAFDLTSLQRGHDLSSYIERLVRVGEARRKPFNNYLKQNPDGALFKFMLPYPHLFNVDVKIMMMMRSASNTTDLERCQLLEECMPYLDTKSKLKELSGAVISLILSIKNPYSVLKIAEKNRKIFNDILDLASTVGSAKNLYLIFANSLHLLDVEVKCTYYRLKHFGCDSESLMELLNDCLTEFERSRDFNGTIECLKTLVELFKETKIDTRLAEAKFMRIADFCLILTTLKYLMDIQVTAKYIDEFDDYLDMWNNLLAELIALSTATDKQAKQSWIASIEVISDALEIQNSLRLKLFAEEHKEIINNIHRQNTDNLIMRGILVDYPMNLDKDLLLKFLKTNFVIPNPTEQNLTYMLKACVDELKQASTPVQIDLLPAIDRLLSVDTSLKSRLATIKKELIEYAQNNRETLNISFRQSYTFRPVGLFSILSQYDDLFDLDVKIKYNVILLSRMTKELKLNFLWKCLENIKSQDDACDIEQIMGRFTRHLFEVTEEEHQKIIVRHKDLINNILYRYVPKVKGNSIFNLIKDYEELWSMEIKIKFAHELLEHYDEDTKWEIVEKCIEDPDEEMEDDYIGSCVALIVRKMVHKETSCVKNKEKLKNFIENYPKVIMQVIDTKDIHSSILPIVMASSPSSFNFEEKLMYLRDKVQHSDLDPVRISIDRNNIVTSSFTETSMLPEEDWKYRFMIDFDGEDGVDCGGISREWFTILTREMFNPNYVLFTTAPGDPNSYMINKASHVNPEHLDYFGFFGRIIAKSIIENQRVHCNFTKTFYKQILNIPVDCSDLESQDPMFFKSMHFLLKHPTAELNMDLTLSTEVQEFGETTIKDLVENGREIPVTDDNKEEYVKLICQMKMTESIEDQLEAFREGFHNIISREIVSIFTPDELEILIAGQPNVDVNNLEANTEYNGYEPTDEHILWFWRALKSFNVVERSNFLMFTTGSPNAPLHGFGALLGSSGVQKFTISKDDRGNRLPTASTCINRLTLPQYDSYSSMRAAIVTAIEEGTEGFYVT